MSAIWVQSSRTRLENLSIIRLDQNNLTSPVPETFANFTVAATATNETLADVPTKTIVVNAYAIQKENVETAADAWAILNS